jgi:hypothetical protein
MRYQNAPGRRALASEVLINGMAESDLSGHILV